MSTATLSPIAKRFAWKEFRTLRGFWIAAFVLGALVQLFFLAVHSRPPATGWPVDLFTTSLLTAALYAVGVAATTFSMEHEEGTYTFLTGLPTRWLPLFTGKMLFASASAVALAMSLTIVGYVMSGGELLSFDGAAFTLGAFGFTIIEALAWGTFFSLILRQPLLAALLTIAAVSVSLSLLTSTFADGVLASLNASSYISVLPYRAALVLGVLLADVLLARQWLVHNRHRQADITPDTNHSKGPIARARAWVRLHSRFRPAGNRHIVFHMLGHLLWQSWRQSWRSMLGMPAIGMLVSFVLYQVTYGWRMSLFQPDDQIAIGPFLFAFIITALYACGVFHADQRGLSYRFLAEHAAWPRLIWLSRLAIWLVPIVILVAAGLFVCWNSAIETRREWQRMLVSMARFNAWRDGRFLLETWRETGVFVRSLVYALWGVAVGLALGQACSMFFRRVLVAGLAACVAAIPLAALAILIWIWELTPNTFFLPMILGLFAATWLRVPDWLVERDTIVAWLKVSLALIVPLIYLTWLLPTSRHLPANANGIMTGQIVNSLGVPWSGPWQKQPVTPKIVEIVAGWVEKNTAANTPDEQATADRLVRLAESIDGQIRFSNRPENATAIQNGLRANRAIIDEATRLARDIYQLPPILDEELTSPLVTSYNPTGQRLMDLERLLDNAAEDATQQQRLDQALDHLLAAMTLDKRLQFGMPDSSSYAQDILLDRWATAEGQTSGRIKQAIAALDKLYPEISDADAPEKFSANGLDSLSNWSPPQFLMSKFLTLQGIIAGQEPSRLLTRDANWRVYAAVLLNELPFERARALAILNDIFADQTAQWYRVVWLTNQTRLQQQARITEAPRDAGAFADNPRELRHLVLLASSYADAIEQPQLQIPPLSWLQTSLLLKREYEHTFSRSLWLQSFVASRVWAWGTRQQLALIAYRIDHGSYPASLDALVPDYLPLVPIDPYSGRPFEYRPEGLDHKLDNNNVPFATPLLWSVGPGNAHLELRTIVEPIASNDDPAAVPIDTRGDIYELRPSEPTLYYPETPIFLLPKLPSKPSRSPAP